VRDWQSPADLFVGRAAELEGVAEILRRAADGQPWLVAIEGDPGMGKTALARQAVAETRVLAARADPAEADLDYGLADQLLRSAGVAAPVIGPEPPGSSFAVGARLLQVVGGLEAAGTVVILVDDLQWADRKSVEALTFTLRRLSVDSVVAVVTYRGPRRSLDPAAQRLLASVEHSEHLVLGGLSLDEVAALAAAVAPGSLDEQAVQRLYQGTGGHPLYVRTMLAEGSGSDPRVAGRLALPPSLADAIGDQLQGMPPDTRDILQMLAVLNQRMPIAQLGQAAQLGSPSAAIEPAVTAGLVDWWPDEPSGPVQIRHLLVRDAIYAGITVTRRRELHGRAAAVVSEPAAWEHRVAALDRPDEPLAVQLEQLAGQEAGQGRLAAAATHLLWASDVSPARADRERRLLTAALHLTMADEARGSALRPALAAAAPSALRSCVLGTMAFSSGQFGEAQPLLAEALEQARDDPDALPLAAMTANRLAAIHLLLGDGARGVALGRQALGTGRLDAAAAARARTLIAAGVAQVSGPRAALTELAYLDPDPVRVAPADVDALSYRGVLRLLSGDLDRAVADLTASVAMVNRGVPPTLGLRAYFYLALAQYLAGRWDDLLLTAEQGLSAASIHHRRYELPLLHLAAACVPAGRGLMQEAERHAQLAEQAAASMDYMQERVYAAMARALVCQATGDYLGMADALGPWREVPALDERSEVYAGLWRPLLAEGLIGSGQARLAAEVLDELEAASRRGQAGEAGEAGQPGEPGEPGGAGYLRPVLAWLRGWLAEQQGRPEQARQIYASGEDTAAGHSPVYTARLLLAHGRLLRRSGQRAEAVDRLRGARSLFAALRAAPFTERADQELAACHLPRDPAAEKKSYLELTSRETEVAHLVGMGLSNPEIAAELFISRKAVEYHLSNIYAKYGIHSRQQLRRLVAQWREPAAV
jgi:DNA-binding CsgD family transcriptional regulator/tetratricopeptide (TPR) repeat protein